VAVGAGTEPFDDLDRMTPSELLGWWQQRVGEVVRVAGELPFYERRFRAAGFDPSAFATLDDIARVPLLSKDDVLAEQRRAGRSFVGLERLGPDGCAILTMSTGTKGSMFLAWPEPWRQMQGRSALRAHHWVGLRAGAPLVLAAPAWHAYAAIQTYLVEELDLPCIVVAGTYLPRFADRILDAITTFRPRFVSTFLPMVFSLLAEGRRRGLHEHDVFASVERLVVVGAPITAGMRAHLQSTTGIERVTEMAGSSENFLAVECHRHDGLHVVPDTCYVEVLSRVDDERAAAGERGRLVYTTAVPWGSLYVRYDGGDAATFDASPCACGLPSPRVKVVGRWDDAFRLGERTLLPFDVQAAMEDVAPELAGVQAAILAEGLAEGRLELVVGHPSPAGLGRRLADGLQAIFDAPVQVGWSDRLSLQFKGVMAVVRSAQVPEEGQHQ
jgi:phenylacetate-CoA ligase